MKVVIAAISTASTTLALGAAWYFWKRSIDLEKKVKEMREQLSKDDNIQTERLFELEEIGRLQAPFPQRAGCPRQSGCLAPHIRSRLIFHENISKEMLSGILEYSHVWIVFQFHLNPVAKASSKVTRSRNGLKKFTSTKIRPPRAGGVKVGVFASRAPHRPNPIGLSLGLVESVTSVLVDGRRHACLTLRGLDLVDDTPVYDVKPYVPWDRVDSLDPSPSSHFVQTIRHLKTPKWVSNANDKLVQVQWNDEATDSLFVSADVLEPLYQDTQHALNAISEVVAQDPRALHDGRGTISTQAFDFTFGALRVSFCVGEDQIATITKVQVDEGDLTAKPGSYPHNLAMRRSAEHKARTQDKKLAWAHSVREGNPENLFKLKNGMSLSLKQYNHLCK